MPRLHLADSLNNVHSYWDRSPKAIQIALFAALFVLMALPILFDLLN
jgi:hypothetical protein